MDTPKPHIVNVERVDGSVVIGFDDGKTALYPAALLYEIFHAPETLQIYPVTTSDIGLEWLRKAEAEMLSGIGVLITNRRSPQVSQTSSDRTKRKTTPRLESRRVASFVETRRGASTPSFMHASQKRLPG